MPSRVFLFTAAFLLFSCATAFTQTNATFLNRIRTARFVMVITEIGDPFDPMVINDDRKAVGDIQGKLADWKRFTLVYRKQDADIVIAVRTAGRVRSNAGVHIGNTSGDQRRRPTGPTMGPIVTADAGPKNDLLSVYDAADYPTSAVLWRKEQKNGLSDPSLPLFEQFKKDVEKAATQKKP